MALINLGGSISTTGTSILGAYSVIFTTDANHTLTVTEYTNKFLELTSGVSLTSTRQLIAPLVQGQEFIIQNNTTGGQGIQVWGGSGGSVTVAPGTSASVVCDGTNYFSPTSTTLAGDVTGNSGANTVTKLQGNPVLAQALSSVQDGYVLTWKNASTAWEAQIAPSGSFSASGDLSGSSSSQQVIGLYSHPLANTAPVESAVPVWDTTSTVYQVRQLTQDDIAPGFSINSFGSNQTVEIGQTISAPTLSASYSETPTTASITNTASIDSPCALFATPWLTAPFTGFNFVETSQTSVTFTLSATLGAINKSASLAYNWTTRYFSGLGLAGNGGFIATGANASGSTAVLVGATATLSSLGLGTPGVGTNLGTFSPSNQKIYFLLPHTGSPHQFMAGGFSFPTGPGGNNVPTTFNFTNQYSAVVSMDLYESTNFLSTSFTVTISA
jgi:hypothetical protein